VISVARKLGLNDGPRSPLKWDYDQRRVPQDAMLPFVLIVVETAP